MSSHVAQHMEADKKQQTMHLTRLSKVPKHVCKKKVAAKEPHVTIHRLRSASGQ